MSAKKEALIATCKGLGIKLDPDVFEVSPDGVVTINSEALPGGTPGKDGAPGKDGRGIKTITGSIDGSNQLTLTITLTDDSQQTVTGQITPTA